MKRIKDLYNKMVSVKGIFALTATGVFIGYPGEEKTFWAFILAWSVFIGGREVYKIVELLKK
jgi:hypothetical protein